MDTLGRDLQSVDFDLKSSIELAERRLREYLPETPLLPSAALGELTGAHVLLKLENLQTLNSFKVRGAFNKLLQLGDHQRAHGVVAASTGNHGAAVALAMRTLGVSGIVFVPAGTSPVKLANIKRLGAQVQEHGRESGITETYARKYATERGMTYVSPYNDWEIISGQGTVGLEILRRAPEVSAVFVPVGGGGLISGIAAYLKTMRPDVKIGGVSPANSKTMIESIEAGEIRQTHHAPTLADATAGGIETNAITFDLCRRLVDAFYEVSEDAIKRAMRLFIENEHMLLEGAGALGIAGLLSDAPRMRERVVVVVVSGANIAADHLLEALR